MSYISKMRFVIVESKVRESDARRIKKLFYGKKELSADDLKTNDDTFLFRMCCKGLVQFSVASWGMEEGVYYVTDFGKTAIALLP